MTSSLDLFQRQQIQTSIIKTEEICYKPLSSIDSRSSLEFAIAGLSDTYIDLSSATIRLKLQILSKKGEIQVNIIKNDQTLEQLEEILGITSQKTETLRTVRSAQVIYEKIFKYLIL